jgi:hypothetical protein
VPAGPLCGVVRKTATSRSGDRNGSDCNNARLTALEIAAVAPMPSEREKMADSVTAGVRARLRAAFRMSDTDTYLKETGNQTIAVAIWLDLTACSNGVL